MWRTCRTSEARPDGDARHGWSRAEGARGAFRRAVRATARGNGRAGMLVVRAEACGRDKQQGRRAKRGPGTQRVRSGVAPEAGSPYSRGDEARAQDEEPCEHVTMLLRWCARSCSLTLGRSLGCPGVPRGSVEAAMPSWGLRVAHLDLGSHAIQVHMIDTCRAHDGDMTARRCTG